MPHIQWCAEPGQGIQSYQTNTTDSLDAELLLSPIVTYCLISGGSLTIPGQNSQHADIRVDRCNDITTGDLVKREVLVSFLSSPHQHIMTGPILSEASSHSWFDALKSVSLFLFFWTLSLSKIFCYLLHLCRWNNTYQPLIQSLVFEKLSINSFLVYKNQGAHECWQMIGLPCQHFSIHYYVSRAISV